MIIVFTSLIFSSCQMTRKVDDNEKPTGAQLIGGQFHMIDQNGQKVTNETYSGKYTLVFFGFTHCPSVCPMGLSTMGRVLNKLPKEIEEQIQPLFVTVDPERDTLKRLQDFTKIFHPRLIGLRGTEKQTQDMVFKYRGYYRKVDESKEYLIDHSDIIYFMDKEGRYLAHFSSSTGVDAIVKKISDITP